jgi:hypothetical protein
VLVPSPDNTELYEVLIVLQVPGPESVGRWFGLIGDDPPPHPLVWREVVVVPGVTRQVQGLTAARTPPVGTPAGMIEWVCDPANIANAWAPGAADLAALTVEATTMGLQLAAQRAAATVSGGPMPSPLQVLGAALAPPAGLPAAAGAVAAGVPAAPAAAPVVAAAGASGALGFAAPVSDAQALANQVLALQNTLGNMDLFTERQQKKKKKNRKKRDSSGSSSRSRSKSSSSSDGASKYAKWNVTKRGAGSVKVSDKQLAKMESLRFKRRSDLVNFARSHPGALGALFLTQVRHRLAKGPPSQMKDLYHLDATVWGAASGLREVRDLREVQLLTQVLTTLGQDRLPAAVDLVCQRIREVCLAKKTGSSWEKAELVSLLPSTQASSSPLPEHALAL